MDSALHYLVYGGDADVDRILRLVFEAREALRDPFSALGVAGDVVDRRAGRDGFDPARLGPAPSTTLFHLLDLYGPDPRRPDAPRRVAGSPSGDPATSSATRSTTRAGRPVATLGRFTLDQLVFAWREIAAAVWMFGFVAVFTVLAVVAVRLLTGAAVVVLLTTLLAATSPSSPRRGPA